ncbi:MAG: adenosylcobinamide-GDP ribazoletransferase [Mariprofundales bacterium]|nr:adenosylcobinamide-GDP ribazoletransferase [Mariprofundales bacterium]
MAIIADIAAAFRLFTRIPMADHGDGSSSISQAARWFPLVGVAIGAVLSVTAWLLGDSPIAALSILLIWIAITGALHLDGAADLADGLGAAHHDRLRLLAVMKEPHIGSFGALALIVIVLTKWVTLDAVVTMSQLWALLLVPAWVRLGALYWLYTLNPLADGLGEMCKQNIDKTDIIVWLALLVVVSVVLLSPLFVVAACATILAWRWFLAQQVGGMSGDCLGAGVEWCEAALLMLLLLLL